MSRLPLHVFTIVLDGMPWLACVYAELMRLHDVPWTWTVVEGAAMNVKDTKWCARQIPRLSSDGTTRFLETVALNPRVRYIADSKWEGKVDMVNAALAAIETSGVLLQVDSDELWTCDQLRTLVNLFEDDASLGSAIFNCRYFVGPNIVTTDEADWWRAWRFTPGDRMVTHEPPRMLVNRGRTESRDRTKQLGLVFDHMSYCLPQHVAYKQHFYGEKYAGALKGWERLQAHTQFPTAVKPFLPWSSPATQVTRVFER